MYVKTQSLCLYNKCKLNTAHINHRVKHLVVFFKKTLK
jgi:hypothetical protein